MLALSVCPTPVFAANTSGLPVPRFVSLKSDETNVRTGPGTRYPIAWVYRRAGMPVEVVEEYDLWRKIRDVEGTTGWVHKTMLAGHPNLTTKAPSAQSIKKDPEKAAKTIRKAGPMVLSLMNSSRPTGRT